MVGLFDAYIEPTTVKVFLLKSSGLSLIYAFKKSIYETSFSY